MSTTSQSDLAQRTNTLLFSVLTTMISLIPTFYVAYISNSVTLYADFLRCLGEFLAILMSWLVFRKISKPSTGEYSYGFGKLEQFASLGVGIAMLLTFAVALIAAVFRFINPVLVENTTLGIIFAALSICGNAAIWVRNKRLNLLSPSPLMDSQARLFRAKTLISGVVLFSLCLSSLSSKHILMKYVDPVGSLFIAIFLLYSAIGVLSTSISDLLDKSLSEVVQFGVLRTLVSHETEYLGFQGMRSRVSGGQVYIDIFLQFAPTRTIREVAAAITRIKESLLKVIPGADISIIIS